jgi:hypothetical protein
MGGKGREGRLTELTEIINSMFSSQNRSDRKSRNILYPVGFRMCSITRSGSNGV